MARRARKRNIQKQVKKQEPKKQSKRLSMNLPTMVIYALFVILPFVVVQETLDTVLLPRHIAVSIGSIILLITCFPYLKQGKIVGGFYSLGILIVAFLFGLSYYYALNQTEALAAFSKWMFIGSWVISLGIAFGSGKLKPIDFAKAVTLFGLINIGFGIQNLNESGFINAITDYTVKVPANFANENLYSGILFLSIPFASFLWKENKFWKGLSILNVILSLALILLIRTIIAWVAVILSSGIFGIIYFLRGNVEFFKKPKTRLISFGLLFLVIGSIVFTLSNAKVRQTVMNFHTVETRFNVWGNTLEMVKEHPLLGVGGGNWRIYFAKYGLEPFDEDVQAGKIHFQRPHNDLLWILAEVGTIGFLLFMASVTYVLYLFWKWIFQGEKEKLLVNSVMASAYIGIFILSQADFHMERLSHCTIIFGFPLVMMAFNYEKHDQLKKIAVPLFAISLVLGIGSYFIADKRLEQEKMALYLAAYHRNFNGKELLRISSNMDQTYYSLDPTSAPIDYYTALGRYSEKDIDGAIIEFKQALKQHPFHISIYNNLGAQYRMKKELDSALVYYRKALQYSPNYTKARINVAEVYFLKKDYQAAYKEVEKVPFYSEDKMYLKFLPFVVNQRMIELQEKETNPELKKFYQLTKDNRKFLKAEFKKAQSMNVTLEKYLSENYLEIAKRYEIQLQ